MTTENSSQRQISKYEQDQQQWLWRYMDLAKFINILNTKTLFIPVSTTFPDKREGLKIHPQHAAMDAFLRRGGFGQIGTDQDGLASQNQNQIEMRKFLLISCWNRAKDESVALWHLYPAGHNGICLRTDIPTLHEQINTHFNHVTYGDIKYKSILSQPKDIDPFFRKQPEYDFEREYRAIIDIRKEKLFDISGDERLHNVTSTISKIGGYPIPIDIKKLIKEVRVHYLAPKWLIDDIKGMVKAFDLDPNLVTHSSLHM